MKKNKLVSKNLFTLQASYSKDIIGIHLEGTGNLLEGYTDNDRAIIIDTAASTTYRTLKDATVNIFHGRAKDLDCNLKKALKGYHEVIRFYFENPPKGFKRPDNIYELCNEDGLPLTFNRRPIFTPVNHKGYLAITLYYIKPIHHRERYSSFVQRLTAMTWIPNPDDKEHVNHIDGNKLNNTVGNLEWLTNQENMEHAINTGLRGTPEQRRVNRQNYLDN